MKDTQTFSVVLSQIFVSLKLIPSKTLKIFIFILFLEKGKGMEKEGEKHQCERETLITGD